MRKFLATTVIALLAMLFIAIPVYANDVTVTIDGATVEFADQQPVIVDGRTLVPVRGVFEELGFYVGWNPDTYQATLTSDDYVVIITIDSATFTTNGVSHEFDVPAQTIGGRTMVPIRFVLESVGYYLDWDGQTQTVLISAAPFEAQAQVQQPTQPIGDIPAYIELRGFQVSTAETRLFFDWSSLTDEDIVPLRYMTNLDYLHLGVNQITDLTPLAGLTNLTQLILYENQITDITPLAGLTNLTELDLAENQITDLSPLTSLTNLTRLILYRTQTTDLTPLAGLTNLTWLNLWDNQIADITPLAGLNNLTNLNLNDNQIADITPLAGLNNLTSLSLWRNQITDWAPVAHVETVHGRP